MINWAGLSIGLHSLNLKHRIGIDFFMYYVAGRELYLDGGNPYSEEVAEYIQLSFLGRLREPGGDQMAFAYPIFMLLPVIPLIWLPYAWAQAIWISFNILFFLSTILFLSQKPSGWLILLFGFFPVVFGLLSGNYVIIISAILLISYALLSRDSYPSPSIQIIMGLLLAWTVGKPQFMWMMVGFLLLWMFRKKLRIWICSFFSGFALLLIFSFISMPTWISAWTDRLVKYSEYNQTWVNLSVILQDFTPLFIANLFTVIFGIFCAIVSIFFLNRWWAGKFSAFYLVAWSGFIVFLFHPQAAEYEQLAFLLPMFIWVITQRCIPKIPAIVFIGGGLVISWIFYMFSRNPRLPQSVAEWPFLLYYVPWMIYLFLQRKNNKSTLAGIETASNRIT